MKAIILALSSLFLFSSCANETKPATVAAPPAATQPAPAPTPPPAPTFQGTCFTQKEGKDIAVVHLIPNGDQVTGHYAWAPHEKDGAHGTLKGTMKDGIITVDYLYMIEGSIQTEEKMFKIDGSNLREASGPLVTKGGREVIKNKAKVTWDEVYIATNCSEVADHILNCQTVAVMIAEQQEAEKK